MYARADGARAQVATLHEHDLNDYWEEFKLRTVKFWDKLHGGCTDFTETAKAF